MDYLLLKWIHILSSTILFGTGLGSAFYMFMANRRKEIVGMYFAVRHVVIADWLFTTPAIVIQFITGIGLAHVRGYALSHGWVLLAIILYFFVGACWVPVVIMQIKMRNMAKRALKEGGDLPACYWHMDKWWIALGAGAFSIVLVIFYLMIFRPVFS